MFTSIFTCCYILPSHIVRNMLLLYLNQHTHLLNYPQHSIKCINACYDNGKEIGGKQEAVKQGEIISFLSSFANSISCKMLYSVSTLICILADVWQNWFTDLTFFISLNTTSLHYILQEINIFVDKCTSDIRAEGTNLNIWGP